jgi:hypothetical protein
MPEINLAKVCFVIEKSRELSSEDAGIEADASNSAGDAWHTVMTGSNASIRGELVQFIRELDVEETAALVALTWIGRGDFDATEWQSAVDAASERHEGPTWKYLVGIPLLPDYLEDALSAFGRSCEGFGSGEGVR